MELVVSQIINGISGSAELFLVAIGLVITFGMLDVVNMAHGEMIMLGAYFGCVFVNSLHLPFAVAVILTVIATGLIGALIEHFLIRKIYGKVAETLLVTFALTYIIQQIVRMIFGPENQNLAMPDSLSPFLLPLLQYQQVLSNRLFQWHPQAYTHLYM